VLHCDEALVIHKQWSPEINHFAELKEADLISDT
jgi:hypothetical protein